MALLMSAHKNKRQNIPPSPYPLQKLKTQPYFLGGDLVQYKHTVPLIRLNTQNMDLIQYLLYQ
jgi:hypothetical protein